MIRSPLLQLLIQSTRGRVVHSLRMLRHPAYLLGFLVGLAWLVLWLGPLLLGSPSVELGLVKQVLELSVRLLPVLHILMSFGLALLLSVWWLMQWGGQPLALQESEVHLLLPAPLARRDILQYVILKNQPRVLLGCCLMSILIGTGSRGLVAAFLSYWLFLTNWDLHAKARNLWLSRNRELPSRRAWTRRVTLGAGILGYWLVFITMGRHVVPSLLEAVRNSATFLQTVQVFVDGVSSSGLWVLLGPFSIFLGLHFASSVVSGAFLLGVGVNLALIAIQNEWVVRSAARFEEAALKKARRINEARAGNLRYRGTGLRQRRRVPFSLRFVNSPARAIIWKNLLASTRIPLSRQVLIGLMVVSGLYLFLVLPLPDWAYGVSLATGLILFFFFPMFAGNGYRNDFRTDLTNLELIRSWPVPSWRFFLAEIGGPAVQIGLYSVLGAGITLASQLAIDSLNVTALRLFPPGLLETAAVPRVVALGWIMLGAAPFVWLTGALCCAMHNLLALNFPGWVPLGRRRQDAAANLGQNLVITLVTMLGMALGILPSALLLGVILRIQMAWFDVGFTLWEVPFLGLVIALPVLVLLCFMVALGAWSWRRLDPSRELLHET